MSALQILSLALAAACLAGVNLYLTVFLAGLAGRLGWLPADGDLAMMGALAHPAVMTVAALLYVLESIVDKIPAVDSMWDALHTVIRPAGAVMLALHIMGTADPAYQTLAGILAGVAVLTTHLAKAATRLHLNNHPGPLANILVSLAEDVLVAGLFILSVHRPVPGFIVCAALVVLLWALFPRMFRTARASLFLMWRKVRLPAGAMAEKVKIASRISAEQDMLVHSQFTGPCTVAWAARCVTGRCRGFAGLKPNTFGHLVSVKEHPGELLFLGRRWFRHAAVKISLSGCDARHESEYLSENLDIYSKADRRHAAFRFTRAEPALAERLEEELLGQQKRAGKFPSAHESAASPSSEAAESPALFVERDASPESSVPDSPAPATPITPFPPPSEAARQEPAAEKIESGPAGVADIPPMPNPADRT